MTLAKSAGTYVFLFILALCCAAPRVFAQPFPVSGMLPRSGPESLLGLATNGILESDADYYLDVNDYPKIDMEKWYAFAKAHAEGLEAGSGADLDEENYLAFFYGGDIVRYDSTTGEMNVANDIRGLYGNEAAGAFLLDTAISVNDTEEDADYYSGGNYRLGIRWGKNFHAGPGLLKPEIIAGYRINQRKNILSALPNTTTVTYEPDTMLLGFEAEYEMERKSNSQPFFLLAYTFQKDFYPRNISEDYDSATSDREDISFAGKGKATNMLRLGYKQVVDLDERFSFGLGADVYLELSSYTAKTRTVTNGGAPVYSNPEKEWAFYIAPVFSSGFLYQWVPGKFALYAGFLAALPEYSYGYRNDPVNDEKEKTYTWGSMRSCFNLGGNITIIENIVLDFLVSTEFHGGGINLGKIYIMLEAKK